MVTYRGWEIEHILDHPLFRYVATSDGYDPTPTYLYDPPDNSEQIYGMSVGDCIDQIDKELEQ